MQESIPQDVIYLRKVNKPHHLVWQARWGPCLSSVRLVKPVLKAQLWAPPSSGLGQEHNTQQHFSPGPILIFLRHKQQRVRGKSTALCSNRQAALHSPGQPTCGAHTGTHLAHKQGASSTCLHVSVPATGPQTSHLKLQLGHVFHVSDSWSSLLSNLRGKNNLIALYLLLIFTPLLGFKPANEPELPFNE